MLAVRKLLVAVKWWSMREKRFERRLWGYYWVLLNHRHFKVKILAFKKDGACSKQFHNYRNELWLFLSGEGHLNRKYVKKGDYVMVPEQEIHQYIALRKTYVLEIQFGDSCVERDIVRVS